MSKGKLLSLILPAMGAALIAVLSQIVIPLGTVPFTLQTLAIGLCASLFRVREATTTLCLYLLLGFIGLPVFAGGASGIAAFASPTAGFLLGFVLYALVTSSLVKSESSILKIIIFNILGDSLVFICGVIGLHILAKLDWQSAFLAGVLPFLLANFLKILAVAFISKSLFQALKQQAYFK